MTDVDPKNTAPQGAPASEPQGSTQPAPQGASDPTPPQGGTQEPQALPDPAEDWQALARKWEKRAQADKAALEALKQKMQGLLTPEQVADQQQQAAQAAAERDRAAVEALRLRVALEKGIPAAMADRLIGTTREELEKDAATVLALIPPSGPPSRIPDAGAGTGRPPAPPKQDLNSLLRVAAGVTP